MHALLLHLGLGIDTPGKGSKVSVKIKLRDLTHISLGHAGTIAANLQILANTGLDVAFTELDIASSTSTANEAQQSSDYETVAKACLAVSSWLGAAKAPLLWDTNCVRKPAYTGVDAAFS
ncbi:hypothetical protein K438DRAFT_1989062 [Mycena galopus ATCC 62051]|nr:hypothetical protein K438DRAFT_1989062 [Mycena galopus ATCC 62051]